ncbi:MAG: type II secretion system protein M [Myxococcaceae bacterium]|nr:type II secretion system protein M [Myxococcaceae bacterium]
MESLRSAIANAQAYFSTLTQRERRMVGGAIVAVLGFIIFITTFSISARADTIRSHIKEKTAQLEQVQELAATFRDADSARQQVELSLRASNVRLATFVEDKGKAAGLSIPMINPKGDVTLDGDTIVESAVEVTLNDIALNRLTDFLAALEAGPGVVKVKYMRIEPRPTSETLSAWLTISTYRMKN